jgi:hypothetical protein
LQKYELKCGITKKYIYFCKKCVKSVFVVAYCSYSSIDYASQYKGAIVGVGKGLKRR